ncbi:MAG: M48 family metalloprotease [Nocardioidaceae bacterium]|nr:M48 family metalloprotease [Nocardioidaceae bacterium]
MHAEPTTWYGRLRQRWVDRAVQRMYERLRGDPGSFRTSPSTRAAVALAVVVIAVALGFVGFLVWATLHAHTSVEWGLVALGWAVVVLARPRVVRLPDDATVLGREEYPALHRVVEEMSEAVGAKAPAVLAVDLDFNAYVTSVGRPLRRRSAMVLGLPMMSLPSWSVRLGVIGHEAGHLRGRDTVRNRLFGTADSVLGTARQLLTPGDDLDAEESWYGDSDAAAARAAAPMVRVILGVLAAPFHAVALLLDRLTVNEGQHREYLADRRSAQVVGSAASVGFLLEADEGLATVVGAAARRGEDPFGVLLDRPPMTAEQRSRRLGALAAERIRADSSHPPTHLRVRLVDEARLVPGSGMPDGATLAAAEAELVRLRGERRRELADLFRTGLA